VTTTDATHYHMIITYADSDGMTYTDALTHLAVLDYAAEYMERRSTSASCGWWKAPVRLSPQPRR
jgi:hypothetical protein